MTVMRIHRTQKLAHEGRCANLDCLAVMEPPINVYDFILDDNPRVFRRAFCIQCRELIDREMSEIEFEVVDATC